MMPEERRLSIQRERRAQSAISRFKTNPDFAKSQVQVLEGFERAKEFPTGLKETAVRMNYALQVLDIPAEAFLMLVSDMKSQDDFITMLGEFGIRAWEEFTELLIF